MYYNPFNKFDIATTTILFLIKNATKLFFKNRWPSIFHEATIVFRMNFSWLSLSFEYSLRFHDLLYLRQQLFFDKLFMTLSLFLFFEILWFSTVVQTISFGHRPNHKSLNNGTLYFPFVISLYALCNSVTYNKYWQYSNLANTILRNQI